MALVACKECRSQISSSVSACPQCGVKNPTGKTRWGAWIVLALVVYGIWRIGSFFDQPSTQAGIARSLTNLSNAGAPSVEACNPTKIGADGIRMRTDNGYHYITGKLANNCDSATGVQIKVTIYDGSGSILSVQDSWPASINNIPAHSTFPFETMIDQRPGAKSTDVRVIAVKAWTAR